MSNMVRWDPFRELEDFQNRLGGFFGRRSLSSTAQNSDEMFAQSVWAPAVDITEDEKSYQFKAELPEVRKEDIKIKVENGVLTLSGERKSEKEEKGKRYHRVERSYGTFMRSFSLPDEVDASRVSALFSHGVLCISVPKSESAKPKLVEIRVD